MIKNEREFLQLKHIAIVLLCGLVNGFVAPVVAENVTESVTETTGAEQAANNSVTRTQKIMSQARDLQTAGEIKQAYQLLQTHADENAGLFEYDYLLGQLALDSGKPVEAIFVLERALDQRPDFAPARAELARAYFLIGENKAAKNEFEKAQQAEMPAASKKLMERYILAIDDRLFGSTSDTSFYLTTGVGYDTNVNTSPSTKLIALPTGTIELASPEDREKDSAAAILQGGGRFSHTLKSNMRLYGNADLSLYQLFDEDKFSTQILDGVLGLHFLHGRNQYKLALIGQVFALDQTTARNLVGINGQWLHTVDAVNQLSAFGQYALIRFPEISNFDTNQASVGATWLHVFANEYQPITHVTVYLGSEDEQTANVDYIGRDYLGFRAGVRVKTSAKIILSGVVSYQQSEYGGPFPFTGGVIREDDFISVNIIADYEINKNWRISPEISYSENDSVLDFFDYDRSKVLITARLDF